MEKTHQDKKSEIFLRFTNFYRCFIKNFSYMAKLLNELKVKKNRDRKKNTKWHSRN